eukprot:4896578-Prymnesium_polylepis.1
MRLRTAPSKRRLAGRRIGHRPIAPSQQQHAKRPAASPQGSVSVRIRRRAHRADCLAAHEFNWN